MRGVEARIKRLRRTFPRRLIRLGCRMRGVGRGGRVVVMSEWSVRVGI
jgi:hypothetical protein